MKNEENQELSQPIIVERREIAEETNPRIPTADFLLLSSRPRTRKTVSHLTIINEHTNEVHHHCITLCLHKKKGNEWVKEREFTLDDNDTDEISQLVTFLSLIRNFEEAGNNYIVIPLGSQGRKSAIAKLVEKISNSDVASTLHEILLKTEGNQELLHEIASQTPSNPRAYEETAAAINIARFTDAVTKLEELIRTNASESAFQSHLEENHWMFGSEYSELLTRRNFTRDQEQDFVFRRTADGFLEIIEIKTPLEGRELFLFDDSHKTFYPRVELTKVVMQVANYIDEIDAGRYAISAVDGENVLKIRAKVVIGRDGNTKQQEALRRLNGHYSRIEVLTFDQLLRISGRVLKFQQDIITGGEL